MIAGPLTALKTGRYTGALAEVSAVQRWTGLVRAASAHLSKKRFKGDFDAEVFVTAALGGAGRPARGRGLGMRPDRRGEGQGGVPGCERGLSAPAIRGGGGEIRGSDRGQSSARRGVLLPG